MGWVIYLSKIFSRQNLYNWIQDELKAEYNSIRVLNIGAGGLLESYLRAYSNFTVTSVDIDPARKPDVVMDACELQYDDRTFDLVCIMEVLEHIQSPVKAVDEIYRVLKPGGKLILTTPFAFGIHDEPHDYYRYTKYGLLYILRHFDRVSVRERNGYMSAVIVQLIRLVKSRSKVDKIIGSSVTLVAIVFLPIIRIIDRLIKSTGITTGYFVVAYK
ncbi:MAG: class I SAM-dependent methyltransferase [Nitrospirae bacterium]|nr:class I SAM-dependent methyltransferase [Nitrospirota bacterium]